MCCCSADHPNQKQCSLLPYQHHWIASQRIVTPQGVISGLVEVKEGKFASIIKEEDKDGKSKLENVIDYGEAVVMPGLIDVHAHLDDPGRSEWEGFPSGTKAAAAGTVFSRETLELKLKAAESRIYVDVGFWGGLVPENAFNKSALEDLLNAGALGESVCTGKIPKALYLYVHAEKVPDPETNLGIEDISIDAHSYLTYLKTRPPSWEEAAIKDLVTLTKDTRIGAPAEGAHLPYCALDPQYHQLSYFSLLFQEGDLDMLRSDHSPTTPELKHLDDGDFLKAWGGISCLQGAIAIGNYADIVVWNPEVDFDLDDSHPLVFISRIS
ncbi:hypothetical protein ACLB2K_047813 [Fragaria x ananassa]